MKKIALTTVAIFSAMTFLALPKQSAEAQHKAKFIAEKANFKQESLAGDIATEPNTTNRANLAQAD